MYQSFIKFTEYIDGGFIKYIKCVKYNPQRFIKFTNKQIYQRTFIKDLLNERNTFIKTNSIN